MAPAAASLTATFILERRRGCGLGPGDTDHHHLNLIDWPSSSLVSRSRPWSFACRVGGQHIFRPPPCCWLLAIGTGGIAAAPSIRFMVPMFRPVRAAPGPRLSTLVAADPAGRHGTAGCRTRAPWYWMLMLLACCAVWAAATSVLHAVATRAVFPSGAGNGAGANPGRAGQPRRVAVVQFVTPGSSVSRRCSLMGGQPSWVTRADADQGGVQSQVFIWARRIPFTFVFGVGTWLMRRSVPVKASFAQQFAIFRKVTPG